MTAPVPSAPFTRRGFLSLAAAGAVLPTACSSSQPPMNVIWLISDDLSPDLGCYGSEGVPTPNIDRLASMSTRFTNAYVTCPVCSPSRSALITGMYQTSIDAHNHRSHRDDGYKLPAPVRIIPDYFREAGYLTVSQKGDDVPGNGKTDYNFNLDHEPFDADDWKGRDKDKPFFAQINIFEPHRSRPPEIWSNAKTLDHHVDPNGVKIPPYYPNHPISRADWAGYLDYIAILDQKVGQVLDRLEREELMDSTVLFFFGDHGRPMPRDKQFLYDGGIRVPLLVRWPGVTEAGAVSDALVNHIDISATSLAAAGIPVPEHLEGRVFATAKAKPRDYIFAARDRCDETVDRIRCVRDKRYKYIRNFYPDRAYMQPNAYKFTSYPTWRLILYLDKYNKLTPEQALFAADTRPPEELYDTQTDPYEVKNLANSEDHREILDRLRKALNDWIETTGDKGAIPEDPAIAAKWAARAGENYDQVTKQVLALDAAAHKALGEPPA